MLFLKRNVPLVITFFTGIIMITAFFAGPYFNNLADLEQQLPEWIQIIMTFTMVLGAMSLLRLNLIKISRKVDGYGYNLVLVIGFVIMTVLGFLGGSWPFLEKGFTVGAQYWQTREGDKLSIRVTVTENVLGKAKVKTGKFDPNTGMPIETEVEFLESLKVKDESGTEYKVSANRMKSWLGATIYDLQGLIFQGVFKAAQATMFSLLAFFVASASFRAFRVKSREAALLMGAAFIVMLGNVPIGKMVTNAFEAIGINFIDISALKEWIMTYPSSAAQSAILIGAMLGYISASMKIILGVERSYLGGEG